MRAIISAIVILFSCIVVQAQEKRALLIGIGDYPAEYGWNKIHGQNDVEIIRQTLNKQGFLNENISVLIDAEATFSNITAAFQSLLEISNKNDIIYLHFSGHGQRITDLDGDEVEDGFDEAWIPYDAPKRYKKGTYEGERHITDDFLYEYLTKLRIKLGAAGKIIVIADACHSGSGSKGVVAVDEVYKRGAIESFAIPRQLNTIKTTKEKEIEDWLYVAACKDYQSNYEYKADNGDYYGILSYVIYLSNNLLRDVEYNNATEGWKMIMDELIQKKNLRIQTMEVEGMPSKCDFMLF